MPLFDRKPPSGQQLGQGIEKPRSPEKKIKTDITSEVKKKPFDMKKSFKRWEIRKELKNPGLRKFHLSQKERVNLEKDVLNRKRYGDLITGNEIKRAMKNLNKKLFETRDGEGKKQIRRQINTLDAILKNK